MNLQFFPKEYAKIRKELFRGNFIQILGREGKDDKLMRSFRRAFDFTASKNQFDQGLWLLDLELSEKFPSDYKREFLLSDHHSFWNNDFKVTLPAVLLSDTGSI